MKHEKSVSAEAAVRLLNPETAFLIKGRFSSKQKIEIFPKV